MTTPEALARLAEILALREDAQKASNAYTDADNVSACWGRFAARVQDLALIAEHLRDEVARLNFCVLQEQNGNRVIETYHHQTIGLLNDEREALAASRERERKLAEELEAVQKDAERYRWLRNDSQTAESHTPTVHVWHGGFVIIGNAHLDAAIDAAIQADTGAKP